MCVWKSTFPQVGTLKADEKVGFPEVPAMKMKRCPVCGQPMKRNGRTSAGTQRWRCRECGSSAVHANDVAARDLKAFLAWLTSKDVQRDMWTCNPKLDSS